MFQSVSQAAATVYLSFFTRRNEKKKKSPRGLPFNQKYGTQFSYFISPRGPHINIIPSSQTTAAHCLYSRGLAKNI